MVEECRRLLTGVGPSIAMGNQNDWSDWLLLPRTARTRRKDTNQEKEKKSIHNINERSPKRLYRTAEKEPERASKRHHQEIRTNDIIPISSHPNNITKWLPIRKNNIPTKKILILPKKTWLPISPVIYHCLKTKITKTTGNIIRTITFNCKVRARKEGKTDIPP